MGPQQLRQRATIVRSDLDLGADWCRAAARGDNGEGPSAFVAHEGRGLVVDQAGRLDCDGVEQLLFAYAACHQLGHAQ
jgi:hypothetical protein